jgi:hypothetical protein
MTDYIGLSFVGLRLKSLILEFISTSFCEWSSKLSWIVLFSMKLVTLRKVDWIRNRVHKEARRRGYICKEALTGCLFLEKVRGWIA